MLKIILNRLKPQAEDHTVQIEATSGEDHHWRTDWLQRRKECHRADLQPMNPLWEISSAPARPVPCLHRLEEGLQQGLACCFVGNHDELQYQHQPYPSHQKPLWQGHWCSPLLQHHSRLVPNNSWSLTWMSTLTHPLQHISGKNRDRCLRRSWRHCQHWRQSNHQPPLCLWHWWLSRRGRRTGKISWVSRQSLLSLRHGDQCQEDQADDNSSGVTTEIKVNGQKLETVTSSKYLGSVTSDEGSKPKILSRIAQTIAALTRLKPVWNNMSIFLSSKIWLTCSPVTSTFLYACESWTLTAEL